MFVKTSAMLNKTLFTFPGLRANASNYFLRFMRLLFSQVHISCSKLNLSVFIVISSDSCIANDKENQGLFFKTIAVAT
jgi:hypothetical protein